MPGFAVILGFASLLVSMAAAPMQSYAYSLSAITSAAPILRAGIRRNLVKGRHRDSFRPLYGYRRYDQDRSARPTEPWTRTVAPLKSP